jgi:hypothetical protein
MYTGGNTPPQSSRWQTGGGLPPMQAQGWMTGGNLPPIQSGYQGQSPLWSMWQQYMGRRY